MLLSPWAPGTEREVRGTQGGPGEAAVPFAFCSCPSPLPCVLFTASPDSYLEATLGKFRLRTLSHQR